MKTRIFLALAAIVALTLTSCDKYKGKAEEAAKKFILVYNDGDKGGVYDMYAKAKEYDFLGIGAQLNSEKLSVEAQEEQNRYVVTIDETRGIRLVFEPDSLDGVKLTDSYGVMKLDSAHTELALKTGVPVKKLSDMELADLLNTESLYMYYLKETALTFSQGLSASYGAYSWRTGAGGYVKLNFSVSNQSDKTVLGKDYYLEVEIRQASTGNNLSNVKTVEGEDIAPGESREFNVHADEVMRYANQRDIRYYVMVKERNSSLLSQLLKYGNITGSEYEKFLEEKERLEVQRYGFGTVVSDEKAGVVMTYSAPSADSTVVDTLYHRMSVYAMKITGNDDWYKLWNDDYQFLGYAPTKKVLAEGSEGCDDDLSLFTYEVQAEGGEVTIYKDVEKKEELRKVKNGTHVVISLSLDIYMSPVLEKQKNGAYKQVGYISNDFINWDSGKKV